MWEGGKEKRRLPFSRQPFCSSLQFTVFGGGWILICCALAHSSFLQSLCLFRQRGFARITSRSGRGDRRAQGFRLNHYLKISHRQKLHRFAKIKFVLRKMLLEIFPIRFVDDHYGSD